MKAQFSAQVSDLRAQLDKAQSQLGDTNVALTGMTNRFEVTEAQRRLFAERNSELMKINDTLTNELKGLGRDPSRVTAAGITAGAPRVNGVISDTKDVAGIPFATISLGSDDSVRIGMEFNILDRESGRFLGKLTVVQVNANDAIGRLSGDTAAVRVGNEVRTHL
jgi:hypothetical protein